MGDIFEKIEQNTVTTDDFNDILSESVVPFSEDALGYGVCPKCKYQGHPNTTRERRPNGNTTCGACGTVSKSKAWSLQEATPESVRNRIRRRTMGNKISQHHQDVDGHQKTKLPTFAARINPKRERADNTQMQGRGKQGHRKSTRTQRRKIKAFAIEFADENGLKTLLEMLESRNYRARRDFLVNHSALVAAESCVFDNELRRFLLSNCNAKRIDSRMFE